MQLDPWSCMRKVRVLPLKISLVHISQKHAPLLAILTIMLFYYFPHTDQNWKQVNPSQKPQGSGMTKQPKHLKVALNWQTGFFDTCGCDFNMLTDVLTSYILFCEWMISSDPTPFAEQLNIFFAQFNSNSTPSNFDCSISISSHPAITIDEQQVTSILHRVKPHKASGPDKLRGSLRTAPLS